MNPTGRGDLAERRGKLQTRRSNLLSLRTGYLSQRLVESGSYMRWQDIKGVGNAGAIRSITVHTGTRHDANQRSVLVL